MRVLREEYNSVVEEIKRGGGSLVDQTDEKNDVLCLLKLIPSSVNDIQIPHNVNVNNIASTSFEFELLNSTSDALIEKCYELLQICDTDEYAKFLKYRLYSIYDSKLETITSTQVYLNTMKSILEQKDINYIPNNVLRLKKVLLFAPYSYTKQKIVEKLQDKVDIGLHTLKFIPIDDEFCDEIINWNIVVASNRFVTIKFATFTALTGITESQLLHNVCKLSTEKKIVVQIDQVEKILSFPLNKVDLQQELNNFFKVYLPNTLEQNFGK